MLSRLATSCFATRGQKDIALGRGRAFRSSAFDSPLCESSENAQVQEIDEETFRHICGQRIPSEEISGMEFWWMKCRFLVCPGPRAEAVEIVSRENRK